MEEFVSYFENIVSLNSYPRNGFNPFTKVKTDCLNCISVDTPETQNNLNEVSTFVSGSKIQKLRLRGIQANDLSYKGLKCPETLTHLTLEYLSNVDVLSVLDTIPVRLQSLKLNDINLQDEGFSRLINKIEMFTGKQAYQIKLILNLDLQELSLVNCETEKQDLFLLLANSIESSQMYSLKKLDLSCNSISPDTLIRMCGMLNLTELTLLSLRTIQNFTAEVRFQSLLFIASDKCLQCTR